MNLPEKIKALPLGEPAFTYERHPGGFCEPERIGAYTYDQMRALLDAAASLAAEHDALMQRMSEALRRADQFISNGIELGFIRMPDADTPDSAHDTPGIVKAALRAHKEQSK